jgi:hypothetical protein
MKNRIATPDRTMQAQLDRLAAGDLPENEREALLAWLDEDIARWRACGLAFLESQLWEGAFACGSASPRRSALNEPRQAVSPNVARRDRSRVSMLTLAAAASIAFAGGLAIAQWLPRDSDRPAHRIVEGNLPRDVAPSPPEAPTGPLLATVPVRMNSDPRLPLMLQLPVSTEPAEGSAAEGSSVSDYDRKKWAKRGFEVHEERRLLPATLPDGRPVVVPVNKVRLEYRGTPAS